MHELDTATLLLRLVLGAILIAHGYNHGFGPGGLAGTTGWFESIGLRPAKVHAAISTYLELAAGTALVVGLATPAAAAAGIGVMVTAGVTVHRSNGFFIFKEGYEYVLLVGVALTSLAVLGSGRWSLDYALGTEADGLTWGIGAAVVGILGSAGMLLTCWRPRATS